VEIMHVILKDFIVNDVETIGIGIVGVVTKDA